jgi:nucleoside-diphosphate-sugar epimerase
VESDIRDLTACHRACADVDSVFHLAALASVVGSIADPLLSHEVNVTGTLNMLVAARDAKARRFVFSSSAAVYGDAEVVPTDENQPLAPQSPYASNKATGEFYCANFRTLYGLETVILRYFNVFGPRQSATSGYAAVVPLFVDAVRKGKTPVIYGDGGQTRDFVYVENVAEANLCAALAENAPGRVFNVAGGQAISLLDLLNTLEEITGDRIRPSFQPARPGEVRHSRADITRARTELGYAPSQSLREGLQNTLEAARTADAEETPFPVRLSVAGG